MANEMLPGFLDSFEEDDPKPSILERMEHEDDEALPDVDAEAWGDPNELVNNFLGGGDGPEEFVRAAIVPKKRWIHLPPVVTECRVVPVCVLDALRETIESMKAPEVAFTGDMEQMRAAADAVRAEAFEDALETLDSLDDCMTLLPDNPKRSK